MPTPIFVLVVAAALIALWLAADRARTLVVCDVAQGKVRVVRGRLPPALLADLRDVAARHRLRRGTIVVRKEGGRPAVVLRDIDGDAARQQLRNVVGRFSLAAFR